MDAFAALSDLNLEALSLERLDHAAAPAAAPADAPAAAPADAPTAFGGFATDAFAGGLDGEEGELFAGVGTPEDTPEGGG